MNISAQPPPNFTWKIISLQHMVNIFSPPAPNVMLINTSLEHIPSTKLNIRNPSNVLVQQQNAFVVCLI